MQSICRLTLIVIENMVMATVTGMALSIVIVLLMVMAEMVAMRIRKIERGKRVGFRKYNPEYEAVKRRVYKIVYPFLLISILRMSL